MLKHICGENNLRSRGHPRADAYWIANVAKEKLRGEPSYRPCTMQQDLQREFGVELEYRKVWKSKELAMHDIHGTYEGCYVRLRCGCRPLIFLDDTHIKNKYKRCILVVVSKDANDDLFTIAYAVVDAENDTPSIIKAVNQLFPGSGHAYCLRHFVDNFVKKVLRSYPRHNKKHWSSVFKKAVYALSFQEYEQHINIIFESMPLARGFILNYDPQSWANALFVGNRWGVINNNIAECWNSWFEVVDGEKSFVVDLADRTCSCRAWYFKIKMYSAAYKGIINPIPTFDKSEENAIIGRGFKHGIALETTYTFERKHCWIEVGLRHLWNQLL
ncbi:uncharacterized protein [Henckelia pumila]|uniref:uncharacterized protein n=1 Tax=Henckelia pumila TaxID=405737 RepID=UPI003C6E630B